MPPLTLWFLQASRSIRIAWLLEELNLEYNVKFFDRVNNKAPPEYKAGCGNPLGKAPTLQDGPLTIYESGAITEYVLKNFSYLRYSVGTNWADLVIRYLCEKYDKQGRLLPSENIERRIKVLQWVHAAEATFLLHGLAITYCRWNIPEPLKSDGTLAKMEEGYAVNVQNGLDWLETELSLSQGRFLCGEEVTAADTMMQLSVDFILKNNLGTQGRQWLNIEEWLRKCENCEGYKRAVEKTGHKV